MVGVQMMTAIIIGLAVLGATLITLLIDWLVRKITGIDLYGR